MAVWHFLLIDLIKVTPTTEVQSTGFVPLLEFCHVASGFFWMGSSNEDAISYSDETPQHELKIPYDYWIGRYPVTVAQWKIYLRATGIQSTDERSAREEPDTKPVRYIKFFEAVNFCDWLTEQLWTWANSSEKPEVQGLEDSFWQGILTGEIVASIPNEPEWEKAARGIDKRIYPWGRTITPSHANYDECKTGTTVPVTKHQLYKSPYGCVDMVGNLWEWTRNVYIEGQGNNGHPPYPYDKVDKKVWESLDNNDRRLHVRRGGSWYHTKEIARAALRCGNPPEDGYDGAVGFRVVVVPKSILP